MFGKSVVVEIVYFFLYARLMGGFKKKYWLMKFVFLFKIKFLVKQSLLTIA